MNKQALKIILDGVLSKKLAIDSAIILIEAIYPPNQVMYPPIPTTINTPDWTYDPYRPGSPWYTVTSTNGFSQTENNKNEEQKTTITTNG